VDIENWKVIGSGGQGEVRKGIYNGRPVAAKSLLTALDQSSLARFLTEVKLLRYFKLATQMTL
jgi:serine/threonine protein kinase